MLHWLAQVVEAKAPAEGKKEGVTDEFNDLMAETDLETGLAPREDTLFDLARKGIEHKLRPGELASNYLDQQE